jgi:DNA invertase Pin-like site-specific DNA recombinase
MSIQVVTYCRVSSLGQVDGDGLTRQHEAIGSFCLKHGATIVGRYEERGVSGTTEAMDRPVFMEMLSAVERSRDNDRPVDAIVVERLDRLARDLMVSEFLLRECRRRKIQVWCADQGEMIDMASNDGADPTRVLIRQILGALAQWEKSVTVRKLRLARERAKARGQRVEGCKPFGSRLGEKDVLKFIDLNKETISLGSIARMLNEGGFKNRLGNPWTKQSVWNLINTKLKGK